MFWPQAAHVFARACSRSTRKGLNWLKLWLPGCYCHECGQCTHFGSFRFPARFITSCVACLTCSNSQRVLYEDWRNGPMDSRSFRMTRWYKCQYWMGCFIQWVGAHFIPKDSDYPVEPPTEACNEVQPEAKTK